ncbi:DUF2971 domain-containing protein [Ralstonia pseudosolanacearum]|uniref:DUF2971 domain-containing protein n=2 Tax=Ralstonia pseudosolanacearum TaxID=1310165 RepID=UPI0026753288|nr:DUF2971 domain-containing protein [Ralstonia pseudosolanacearum]MDO3572456.1 DUF2971 domain-containing protein [Ralstonia pseudosolanacearum]
MIATARANLLQQYSKMELGMGVSINEQNRLSEIFFPIGGGKIRAASDNPDARFAYYTTADVARSVISGKSVWMRNASTMNDYSEIEHGMACVDAALNGEVGQSLRAAIDRCHDGLWDDVVQRFRSWSPGIKMDTFITCVSEHLPQEREFGRLSMWRAYGGRDGVALVLNGQAMLAGSNGSGPLISPVEYLSKDDFVEAARHVAKGIEAATAFLKTIDRYSIHDCLFHMLLFSALCVKHPGFAEEREWRIFTVPTLWNLGLKMDVEVVRGTPQHVVKLPLEVGFTRGVTELVEEVIIGPCSFPHVAARAFRQLFADAGLRAEEASARVTVSGIPLRHF